MNETANVKMFSDIRNGNPLPINQYDVMSQ